MHGIVSTNNYPLCSWSDGKGNPKRNALPECQLKSIQDKVEALYAAPRADPPTTVPLFGPWTRHGPRDPHRQPRGFWMDTLCIPVGESEAQVRCKRKAIGQMRKIYEDADRVLVLDDRIQQLSVSSPFCDRAISLIVSNWQSRIWTLQEGVMAQQLFIQFSDGVFTLIELQEEEGRRQSKPSRGLRHGASPKFWHRVSTSLLTLLSISLRFDPEEEHSGTFAPDALFSALIPVAKRRLTSRREDETICLSTLLRLDLGPLLSIRWNFTGKELRAMSEEQRLAEETRVWEGRMKRFLCMIGCFEKSIIFNALPRLSGNGFRWAPSSFLGQSGASNFVDHEWFHQVTSRLEGRAPILFRNTSGSSKDLREPDNALGFMVTFPGIMLHAVSRSQIEAGTFYVREKRFRRFLYHVTLKDSPHLIDLEHSANQYALITLGAATLDRNSAIPAVFGVFLGMVDKRVRKLRHLSVARVTLIDRRREMAKEKAKYVQVHRDELEEGEAWVDEDSDNWKSAKDEESEDDSEDDSGDGGEDLGYALSDKESGGDSENSCGSGERPEVDANSGSDGDHDQEVDSDSDDEEDDGEDGGHADNITGTRTNGKIDRDPPLEQIVYGKVLLMDNNKWCIM
jgi:hypothetical protein